MGHFSHGAIIRDIKLLIGLLKKYKFDTKNKIELSTLENIVGNSSHNSVKSKGKKICIKHDINELTFNISNSGMKAKPESKTISVTVDCNYSFHTDLCETEDIFTEYSLQLYVKGYPDKNNDEKFYFFCWHLDRETNTNGNLIHPYYHLHAGGQMLDGYELGDLLMISSPRIPHPPMDIILVIHFVILNFLHSEDFKEQKQIIGDEEYIAIIERAQKRILEPYFSVFNGGTHTHYTKKNLFPLYV